VVSSINKKSIVEFITSTKNQTCIKIFYIRIILINFNITSIVIWLKIQFFMDLKSKLRSSFYTQPFNQIRFKQYWHLNIIQLIFYVLICIEDVILVYFLYIKPLTRIHNLWL